jgi:ATP-dependent protease Clp ATPase subunit
VISQEDAKRVLAVAICDHYNHCRRTLLQEQEEQYKMMTRKQQNTNTTTTYNKEDIADLLEALDDSSSSSSSYSFDYAKPNVLLAGPVRTSPCWRAGYLPFQLPVVLAFHCFSLGDR